MSAFHPRRFDRAAATYGALSGIQERMADALVALLPSGPLPKGPAGILEFGCGTGHLTRRLHARFPASPLFATDAAPRMLEAAAQSLAGEAETAFAVLDARGGAPVPDALRAAAPFALAASNALVQWFPELSAHFSFAAGLLAPHGICLVGGFQRDNFPELNSLLSEAPFGFRDFPGHDRREVEASARLAGFGVEAWREGAEAEEYPDARAFLAHIQGLGSARRPDEGRPLTRGSLALLLAEYHRRYGTGEAARVRATWKPWYALLRKA